MEKQKDFYSNPDVRQANRKRALQYLTDLEHHYTQMEYEGREMRFKALRKIIERYVK